MQSEHDEERRKLEELLRGYLANKERNPAGPIRRFAIALSFPGEARDRVAAIARYLAEHLGRDRVLYDQFHEAEFARPNLDVYLQDLYHDEAELNVVFLCKEYETKEWCGLEWRAIRDLLKHRRQAIMFLRLDDTPVSGVFSIDGYIDISERSNDDTGALILQRWNQQREPGTANHQTQAATPGTPRQLLKDAGKLPNGRSATCDLIMEKGDRIHIALEAEHGPSGVRTVSTSDQ
jgi:hypothetical protein